MKILFAPAFFQRDKKIGAESPPERPKMNYQEVVDLGKYLCNNDDTYIRFETLNEFRVTTTHILLWKINA